jgi:predicted  nucleic acid-binding Zn-ribbon protein
MGTFPRGSEWRKWDLHVHTPFTKLNNKYSLTKGADVWMDFCERVERSDVEAFGITDYFSVENYFTFKKKFQVKYPKSEKAFFPNIELRVDRSSNNHNEGYDLHLVFDNELEDSKLEEFLRNLKLDNTDGTGKQIKASELKSESDFKTAFTTIPFIDQALKDTFGDKKPYFRILMAHGHGGMQPEKGDSRKNAVAEETDKRVADIYFGCDEKDRDFFLNDRGKVKKKKPCVSGSDAHSFKDFDDKIGKKFQNNVQRYTLPTWIKADKTFEGLRQITHEPQERVFLGDKPNKFLDVESNRSRFVDSIKVENKDITQTLGWFNDEIPLNSGLVAIIGRKGQGKSALADIIGFCGRTKIDPDDFSFLRKDKFRKKCLAKDYQATLRWLDGTLITESLDLEVNATDVEKVKYLPQKYVETICNDEGVSSQFQKEINKVIFSYIPDESRLNTTSLGDLINVKTSTIDVRIAKLKTDLHSANERIVKLEGKCRPQYLESLKSKLVAKQQELKALVKPKPVSAPKNKLKKSDQTKLNKIIGEIDTASKAIDTAKVSLKTVNDKLQKLSKLKAAVVRLAENAESVTRDFADDARLLSIDLSKLLSVEVDNKILDRTERKLSTNRVNLEELLDQGDTPSPKSLYAKKLGLETQKEGMVNTLGEDQKKIFCLSSGIERIQRTGKRD